MESDRLALLALLALVGQLAEPAYITGVKRTVGIAHNDNCGYCRPQWDGVTGFMVHGALCPLGRLIALAETMRDIAAR